jgi:hypothetical protein
VLVFVDESGDPGFRPGSSAFFTVALVLFEEEDEATACDQRIALLRRELRLAEDYEFRFSHNSRRVRSAFLQAIEPYGFFYTAVALNKGSGQLWGPGFQHPHSLYLYVCRLVFENAKQHLRNGTIVVDRSGGNDFQLRLARYLRQRNSGAEEPLVKKVKVQDSHRNNLLQLADYVVGAVNRRIEGKAEWGEYGRYLAMKELRVQVWPPSG